MCVCVCERVYFANVCAYMYMVITQTKHLDSYVVEMDVHMKEYILYPKAVSVQKWKI